MLTRRLIACLDVRHGRVVKGIRFGALRDVGDPADLAARYEQQGADEIVLLDVSATLEGRGALLDAVGAVRRAIGIPLTVGGGIRSAEDARALLRAGADKTSVNSAAVDRPGLLSEMAECFGRQCVVLAVDAARRADRPDSRQVVTRSGQRRHELDAPAWAAHGAQLGAGEILLTSLDRDGTQSGYDLALLSAVSRAVSVPVIASGGARTPGDLADAFAAGAEAALVASILHDGHTTVEGLKNELARLGVTIRP